DPEDSAEDDDEDYEDDDESHEDDEDEDEADEPEESRSNGSVRSRGQGLRRQPMLGSLSQLLLPLAGEAADSAGRYVGEQPRAAVSEHVMPRCIDAFEQAS